MTATSNMTTALELQSGQDLLTIDEAASIVRAPVATLRYWRHLGTGPHSFRIGRRVVYRHAALHPCKGVKLPPVPRTRRDIVSPDQFDALHAQLPNAASRLLVEAVGAALYAHGAGEQGQLRITSTPGAGTMVTVTVDLPHP